MKDLGVSWVLFQNLQIGPEMGCFGLKVGHPRDGGLCLCTTTQLDARGLVGGLTMVTTNVIWIRG